MSGTGAILNMAMVFGLVQLANKFQLDAPENTDILRITYGGVQVIAFLIIGFIYYRIKQKNDKTKFAYSEPKPPFSADEPEVIRTTFVEYDISQLKALVFQTLMGIAIISFMHFKWGYLRPLLLQSVLGLKTLSAAPVIQVWLFGKDMQRPWKQPSPFGNTEQVTDKEQKLKEKKEEKSKISGKAKKKTE